MKRRNHNVKKQKSRKGLWITLSLIVIALVVAYGVGATYFQSHFLPNTVFEDQNLGCKTVDQANATLDSKVLDSEQTIQEGNETIATFTPKEAGISIDIATTLKNQLKGQNALMWPIAFFESTNQKLSKDGITIDDNTYKSFFDQLGLDNDSRQKSEDAHIEAGDKGFEIVPEVSGTQVDPEKLKEAIVSNFGEGKNTIDLTKTYYPVAVTKDDDKLKSQLEELNDKQNSVVTIAYNGLDEEVPTEDVHDWIYIENDEIKFDYSKITAYAEAFSDKVSTYKKTRKFKSTNDGEVEIKPGTYGWTLSSSDLADKLYAQLNKGEDGTIQPTINGSGLTGTGDDIGNTYIEVSIKDQHMWYYKDGKLALDTPVVTGHPETPTVTGAFYVWEKERDAILRGENNRTGQDYESPVDYWMPFNWNGYGIHDSPWQPAYGGDNWKIRGSNGCVNTPPEVMAKLFDTVEIGTPVLVY